MANTVERFRRVFNAVDPVGIFFDENIDEYDPEITKLIDLSLDYNNLEEVDRNIKEIFAKQFENVEIDPTSLEALAKSIHLAFRQPV